MKPKQQSVLTPADTAAIRHKVRRMIGQAGYTFQHQECLQQELTARLLRSLRTFDPLRGTRGAFVATVLNQHGRQVLRQARAQKRGRHHTQSLDIAINQADDAAVSRAAGLCEGQQTAHRQLLPRHAQEHQDLRIDVDSYLKTLPPDLRDLAILLKFKSIAEIARERNLPRTTLNGHVRKLRQRFQQTGLREYL